MKKVESPVTDIRKKVLTEIRILQEIKNMQDSMKNSGVEDRKKMEAHIKSLELYLKKTKDDIVSLLENVKMNVPLSQLPVRQDIPAVQQSSQDVSEYVEESPGFALREIEREDEEGIDYGEEERTLERKILKRLKKKEEDLIIEKKFTHIVITSNGGFYINIREFLNERESLRGFTLLQNLLAPRLCYKLNLSKSKHLHPARFFTRKKIDNVKINGQF